MTTTTTQLIDDIVAALPQLGTVDVPRPTLAVGTAYHPTPGSRVPIDLEPDAMRQHVHATCTTWVRLVHEEGWCQPDDWPATDDTHWLLLWLRRHATTLDTSDVADDWQRDLARMWRRTMAAVGKLPPPPLRLPCRRCGNVLEGVDEAGQPASDPAAWRWARCPLCGQTETLDDDLHRLAAEQSRPARLRTIAEWAEHHGTTVKALQRRIEKACTPPDDRGPGGVRLYLADTITALLGHDTQENAA